MSFSSGFKPPETVDPAAYWFIFKKDHLLLNSSTGSPSIPETRDLGKYWRHVVRQQFIGNLDGRPCYAADMGDGAPVGEGLEARNLHSIFNAVDEKIVWAAGRANQLATWSRNHRYCGMCGARFEDKKDERAKICPACGLVNYPRLSPAVIVAILRENRILLARNRRFRRPFFSVLAGFVEPGETLEACVAREVEEEVGILVENIRYFGSQPWPFPDSLMVGFVADYAGGEIQVDDAEITEADWFTPEDLPRIPPRISIARQLIDWFATQNRC